MRFLRYQAVYPQEILSITRIRTKEGLFA